MQKRTVNLTDQKKAVKKQPPFTPHFSLIQCEPPASASIPQLKGPVRELAGAAFRGKISGKAFSPVSGDAISGQWNLHFDVRSLSRGGVNIHATLDETDSVSQAAAEVARIPLAVKNFRL